MITHYLRFADVTEAESTLSNAGWVNTLGSVTPPPAYRWDVIGPVVVTPPTIDLSGNEVTPAVVDNRCHVNVYDLDEVGCPSAFADFEILVPGSPVRRFGMG